MPSKTSPKATVVITTKNRSDDLRRALASVVSQDIALEVLVIDDGSTDGTSAMVRNDFPTVRLVRSEQSQGYIVQRNRAAELARAPVIVSIDDDAEFSSSHVISQSLADLDCKCIGAVAIPFVDVQQGGGVRQQAPTKNGVYITDAFVGTAHALRRDLFLRLGGYRDCLFHQGEERDFCLRMLEAGFFTRLGSSDPIYHYESPRRDFRRMDLYGRRNDVLFAWHNVPTPMLLKHIAVTTMLGVVFGMRVGRPLRMILGLCHGYSDCYRYRSERRPVTTASYQLFRRLRKAGPLRLDEIRPLFHEKPDQQQIELADAKGHV